jgi:diguanylate cyclase (GGDEF)-like protein
MKSKERAPYFLIFFLALRFGALAAGFLLLTLPTLNIAFSGLFTISLLSFELILSLFQAKLKTGLGYLIIGLDLIVGILLIKIFKAPFFLLAVFFPIVEGFYLSVSVGSIVSILELTGILIFLIPILMNFPSKSETARELSFHLIILQTVLGVIILILSFLTQSQEQEAHEIEDKRAEEEKKWKSSIKKAEAEIERLFRELFDAKKEVEGLRIQSQTSLNQEREDSQTMISDLQEQSEAALSRLNDLTQELENTRKERENLMFLLETSGEMHKSLVLEETLVSAVETIEKAIPSQTSVIFLAEDQEGQQKIYAEVAASIHSDYFRNYSVSYGEGVVGWVAQEKEPAIIENGSLLTTDGHELTTLISNEKSAVIAPLLKKDGTLLGIIYLGQAEPKAYSWQDVNVLLKFIPHIQNAIAKAKQYHDAISQGINDSMTGLYNKVYFEERLSEEIKRAYRYSLPLALIFLELDQWKEKQKSLSEAEIKGILTEAGGFLKGYLRDVDVLARIGEGKFAIILLQAEKNNAILIADRIRLAMQMRAFGEEIKQKLHLTVSIGVSVYPKDAQYKSDLMAKCEKGLEQATAQGGNKTCMGG